MGSDVTIKPVGDWGKQVHAFLKDALSASVEICGRTGAEACKHALILMAESARAMTPKAKARRPILRDQRLHGAQYVETYQQGKDGPTRIYKFQYGKIAQGMPSHIGGDWDRAKRIGGHGLASRSWMWGLKHINRPPIPGASRIIPIITPKAAGYIKENRISYILKIMPAGWEALVEKSAGNKIMQDAARAIERKVKQAWSQGWIGRPPIAEKGIGVYFLRFSEAA